MSSTIDRLIPGICLPGPVAWDIRDKGTRESPTAFFTAVYRLPGSMVSPALAGRR